VKRWLVVEVALLVGAIAIVWWLGDHATAAWLHRGDRLKSATTSMVERPTWDVATEHRA
jgi:hypothetical protein